MILLRKNQLSTFAVTLNELANPNVAYNWLFRFRKEQSKESYEYLIFLTDDSPNTERYNQFDITEGTDLEMPIGDYEYRVYQMPDTTDTDYTRGTQVEIGKMRLIDTPQVIPTFITNNENPIYDQEYIS
jgi:hypothetical protein